MVKIVLIYLLLWQMMNMSLTAKVTPLLQSNGESAPVQPITWKCVQRIEAEKKWKQFQSMGYPKRLFVRDSRCSWKISTTKGKRIKVAFGGIDLLADDPAHCSANYVEIIDENLKMSQARYCGKNIPGDIVSSANKLRIDFQAQPGLNNDMKGFKIGFVTTKDEAGFYTTTKSLDPKAKRKAPTQKTPRFIAPTSTNEGNEKTNEDTTIPIVVGVVVALLVVGLIGFFVWRRKTKLERNKKLKLQSKEEMVTQVKPQLSELQNETPIRVPTSNPLAEGFTMKQPLFTEKHKTQEAIYINCQPPPLPLKSTHSYLSKRNSSLAHEAKHRTAEHHSFDQLSIDTRRSNHAKSNLPYRMPDNHRSYINRRNGKFQELPVNPERSWRRTSNLDQSRNTDFDSEMEKFRHNHAFPRSRSRANRTLLNQHLSCQDRLYLPEHLSKSLPVHSILPPDSFSSVNRQQDEWMNDKTTHRDLPCINRSKSTTNLNNPDQFLPTRSQSFSNKPLPMRCKSISDLCNFEQPPNNLQRLKSSADPRSRYSEKNDISSHQFLENERSSKIQFRSSRRYNEEFPILNRLPSRSAL